MQRSIDMRYRRQVHILTVPVEHQGPLDDAAMERTLALFERLYEQKYGKESAYREAGIELVSFRLRGSGTVRKPELHTEEAAGEDASHAIVKTVQAWVDADEEVQELNGYDFERMLPGNAVGGPAILWTPITTLVLAPGQVASVDGYRNLLISMAGRRAGERRLAAGAHAR
jgi:N-methylhydantoinase A